LKRFAEKQIVDQRIGREGQVMTVLLDRGSWQNE
jgi:hypothetical protein